MKLFKKAREALKRLTGNDKNLPPPAPAADPVSILPEIFDPLPEYQQRQRDFEARAKATAVVHSGGTFNKGLNRDKRRGRTEMIERGASPRVAKRKQRDGITFEPLADA